MAQLGRISGQILKDNLLREGVDIAFETDLLYIDVNNDRLGVNTNTPSHDLQVAGSLRSTNLIATTSLLSGNLNVTPNGNITPTVGNIYFAPTRSVVVPSTLNTPDIRISNNFISTNTANRNLELRPNGVGSVDAEGLLVNANLHATGDITADGNIILGSGDDDNITFNADVISNIIPNTHETFDLGETNKVWNNLYTKLINGENVGVQGALVSGVNPFLDVGNSYYVTKNGSDSNAGLHTYESFLTLKYACSQASAGDTIIVFAGEYEEVLPITVPAGVTIKGNDFRNTIIKPTVATNDNDVFLLNGETSIVHLTIKDFYYNSTTNEGHAFRFAPSTSVTSRSPYLQDITVITKGSTVSASDPRGFAAGDAGKGALIDGAAVLSSSQEASMLFHSCTFITPGVDGITMTNGVRVEWLNSFTYFANRGLYAVNGVTGHQSTDGSTLKYGAELRSIGSANVYGNYGVVADGADCLMYLIQHNFGYIGTGKDVTNDTGLALQAREVSQLNSGKIYYSSTDHLGNFRIGDSFFVDFENGSTTVDLDALTANALRGLTVTTGEVSTVLAGTAVTTGNLRFLGNDITSFQGDIIIASNSGEINLTGNTSIDNDLSVTGNLSFGGSLNLLGNESTDTLNFNVDFDQDFNPHSTGNFDLGKANKLWNTVYTSAADVQNIRIQDNFITTVNSNDSLELRAHSTGKVLIPGNNVQINNDHAVNGLTTLSTTGITGTLTHAGNYTQTGNTSVTGNSTVSGYIDVSGQAQFEEILVDDNFITTTTSNTNLELRVNGVGMISIPTNNVTIQNDLTVSSDISTTDNIQITNDTEFNRANVSDIDINQNYIQTNNANKDLDLRATGKIIINDDASITQNLSLLSSIGQFDNTTVNGTIAHTGVRTHTGDYSLSGELLTNQFRFEDNFITTKTGNTNFDLRASGSGEILVPSNTLRITNNLTVSTITDVDATTLTGTLTVNAPYNQIGTTSIAGSAELNGTISINANTIETIVSNANLDIRASGTGKVRVPFNNTVISNDLTVNGTTTLNGSYTVNGVMTHVGNINQQGNFDLSGELISDELKIEDNFITTVTSNSDLELRAHGSGNINVQNNVTLAQDLTVSALTNLQATDITGLLTQVGNRNHGGNYSLSGEFKGTEILIEDNFITTTTGNTNLELRSASSPITVNDGLQVDNALTVIGNSVLTNTGITGLITLNGQWAQTGNVTVTGVVDVDDIKLSTTASTPTIETVVSNADLELLANGSGKVKFLFNNVEFDQDLTVNGISTFGVAVDISQVNVNGTLTHAGNYAQTGNRTITGNLTGTQDLNVGSQAQFEEILFAGNVISTTNTNADLELRTSGTGEIVSQNRINVTNDLFAASITTGDINVTQDIDLDDIVVNSNNIQINENYIETTISNSNLELRADNSGSVILQEDVSITNDLTINGISTLQTTNVTGTLTRVGNTVQTGNAVVTGDLTVTQDLNINARVEFEEIVIDDNIITTKSSNSDLELKASGSGSIIIPNNDVTVSQNMSVGTLNSTGITINDSFALENMVSSTDIDIFDNVITTTNSNSDLELRANGTGSIYLQDLVFNTATISSAAGITLQAPNLLINSTGAFQIPVGTVGEILLASAGSIDGGTASISGAIISGGNASTVFVPADVIYNAAGAATGGSNLGEIGTLRYNTTDNAYEGFNQSVLTLGQITSDDRNTSVSVHPTNDTITFIANNSSVGTIDSTGLNMNEIQVDDINIANNVISTANTNADLDLVAHGTGNIKLENVEFDLNFLDIDTIGGTGTHIVVFPGNRAVKFPSGTTAQRPASPVVGQTRHNSTLNELEVWIGTKWQNAAGEFEAVTQQEMEDEALVQTLIYG